MILTNNLGYPRIGKNRELKFALESYWKKKSSLDELQRIAEEIQINHWKLQQSAGIDLIPSNDFSFYDHVLDTAIMLGAIPQRFSAVDFENDLDLYFAMARGFQPSEGENIPAMEMTKWFNTNYHYIVPEIGKSTRFYLNS
jgi:5-methyltetrahydropteroyltriglutamate--homocysteine methyltransferase